MQVDCAVTDLDRFDACMEYEGGVARPNHELGAWRQTRENWLQEAPDTVEAFHWDWFSGESALGLDRREFIPVNFGFMPPFDVEILEETAQYIVRRNQKGIVTKALRAGSVDGQRACMDQFLEFPVKTPEDFQGIKKRMIAGIPARYPADLAERATEWQNRDHPLILGRNCSACGFFWRARELMGTETLCYAWYDYPDLMHEMMEFFADFIMEVSRPVLETVQIDYFNLNEDFAMKTGPLLSPEIFRTFIFPHLRRLVEFFKSHGTRYVTVDSDGNPEVLIPLLLEAGIDVLWPLERASSVVPGEWRAKFGRDLRMWGGVDKRVLAKGGEAIRAHLREFIPLIEEGGFVPTVDHTVPPDVSWDNFREYMDCKRALLAGDFVALGA